MKPIIMDMKEMSLSKEVYDKKPGLFFSIFIYGLLTLLLTALTWAYFGRLDIVIRAQGIIRPHAQTAVIINAIHGEVSGAFFYEGQRVYQGDILFAIDTFHLENDRRLIIEQLDTLNFELESLKLFSDSIDAGENLINSFNEEASARFDSFIVNLNSIEHGTANRLYLLQEEERALETAIQYANFELTMLRVFENSISQGQSLFGAASATNSSRNREVHNNYQNQFMYYTLERDNLYFQIDTMQTTLDGFNTIRNSIEVGYSLFPEYIYSIYRSMYEEYLLQKSQLQEAYALAADQYQTYTTLHDAGVAPFTDLQSASTHRDTAHARLTEFKAGFTINIDNEIRTAENTLTNLQTQLEILHIGTLAGVSNQTVTLESSIADKTALLTQSRLQQDSMFFIDYQDGNAAMLRLTEINRTLGQINNVEQEITRLTLNLTGIDALIEESTVRAPIDGEITVNTELTEGGFIMSGIQILSIIPNRDEMLSANIFINNNDIGQISEGMTVRYDIAAMPRRESGEIAGQITRISTDIAIDQGMQGYFIVESELEDRVYYDARGNGTELRVGMGFEARIIVEQQRILFYLLDRINLF